MEVREGSIQYFSLFLFSAYIYIIYIYRLLGYIYYTILLLGIRIVETPVLCNAKIPSYGTRDAHVSTKRFEPNTNLLRWLISNELSAGIALRLC